MESGTGNFSILKLQRAIVLIREETEKLFAFKCEKPGKLTRKELSYIILEENRQYIISTMKDDYNSCNQKRKQQVLCFMAAAHKFKQVKNEYK